MRSAVFAVAVLTLTSAIAACASKVPSQHSNAAPKVQAPDTGHGRDVYEAQCAACHGRDGTGGEIGPSLRGERARRSPVQIRDAIVNPEPPMPKLFPARLSAADVHDVAAFVETL